MNKLQLSLPIFQKRQPVISLLSNLEKCYHKKQKPELSLKNAFISCHLFLKII